MSDQYNYVEKAREFLIEIAEKDGVVTEEEKTLIDSILDEVRKYEDTFKEAVSDKILDPTERLQLFKAKLNILRKAAKSVHEDLHVSADEEEILLGLRKIFPDLQDIGDDIKKV